LEKQKEQFIKKMEEE
jgi:hypothetical protein